MSLRKGIADKRLPPNTGRQPTAFGAQDHGDFESELRSTLVPIYWGSAGEAHAVRQGFHLLSSAILEICMLWNLFRFFRLVPKKIELLLKLTKPVSI